MPFADTNFHELANELSGPIAVAVGVAIFGLVLWLVQKFVPPIEFKLDLKRKKTRPSRRARRGKQQPAPVPTNRPAEEWGALTEIVENRAEGLQAVSALQGRAVETVDAAQYALDRLLAEYRAVTLPVETGVMPEVKVSLGRPEPAMVVVMTEAEPLPEQPPLAA